MPPPMITTPPISKAATTPRARPPPPFLGGATWAGGPNPLDGAPKPPGCGVPYPAADCGFPKPWFVP